MNLAELFVAIGIKIENLDQLAALETMLRNVTAQARAAVVAISQLNGVTVQAPTIQPVPAPGAPAVPVSPIPNAPAQPPVAPPGFTPPPPVGPTPPAAPAPGTPFNAPPVKVVTWTQSVKSLSTYLNKLAVIVTGVSAGILVLTNRALQATMDMANFGTATGLSTEQLQGFQHAAQVGGASAKGALALLDSLQLKQAAIQLGEGDLSPFAFFGIDPNQDTNAVIDQLRAKLKTFSKEQLGVAREMAARMGVDSQMFAALKRNAAGLSSVFVLDQSAIDSTEALNEAWQDLSYKLAAIRNQFLSSLAPTLTLVASGIAKILKPIAVFVKWLNSGTMASKAARNALAALAIVLGIVAIVIVAVAGAVALLSAGLGIASSAATILGAALWASGIAEVILLISAVVAAAVATFTALVLVVDDIITTFQGGESACRDIGEAIGSLVSGPILWLMDAFTDLGNWAGKVWDSITDKISGAVSAIGGLVPDWIKNLFGGDGAKVAVDPMKSITDAAAQPPSNQRGGGGTSNQTNEFNVNVNGAQDPRSTGKEVVNQLAKSYSEAVYQMPVRNY